MKTARIIAITFIAAVFVSCANTSKTQIIPAPELDLVPISADEIMPNTAPIEAAVPGDFSFNLFKAMSQDESICISPFSLGTVLAMAAEGANGRTADQMAEVLGKDFRKQPGAKSVKVANSIWVDKRMSLKTEYSSAVQQKYSSRVFDRDFTQSSTVREINHWCSDNTEGKIPSIIEQINPSMRVILLNAVYFFETWKEPFLRVDRGDFTCIDDTVSDVYLMRQTNSFPYFRNDVFQMVELPYEGGETSMVILLPMPNVSFKSAVASLNSKNWRNWLSEMSTERVRLTVPRFKLECDFDVTKTLQAMGMSLAFTSLADFSKMSDTQLCIDFVKQKTYIDVNEKGTEAAAVSGLTLKATSVAPDVVIDFTADRPFIYVIKDNADDEILFIGQITAF